MRNETIAVDDLELDPYPIYAHLRKTAPVSYVPEVNLWFVTRFRDVEFVSKSPDIFTAEVESSPLNKTWGKPTILTSDGEPHRYLRSGVDPAYHPKRVLAYMEQLVLPIASECLARLKAKGGGDLMTEYFEPISILSLTRSLGLDGIDIDTLRRWFFGLAEGAINFECNPDRQEVADKVSLEVSEYVQPMMEKLIREPDDSALSHMIHDGLPDGEFRSVEKLMPTFKVLLLGGMQEPGHGGGSIMTGLLQNPDQLAAVAGDLDRLLPRAIEEGLRWVTPIGTQTRQTTCEVELGGVTIPAGQAVAAVIASAARCESRFINGEKFDIFREERIQAAFGFGHHSCAGRWFARQQLQVCLRYLLENAGQLHLAGDQSVIFKGWEFRAPTRLNVHI